ncbi:hypothetical protein XvhCFBP2543_06205 [Xanthomonas vasicola]|uniref:Uncharacterized protein n=1 Tax=Xanthomonas vasicola TaxID=56459 RepID=A0ABD7SD71_XANVA|nr:hypothetical protein NX05_21385 [Xanthomonas vasicola]KGR42724.1 hypothetical protein NX04_10605 [Xanthomonas vasicola]KGR60379.1 hypothetical protein NX79_10875 [Xanthomonas vasicola]PPV03422.1 hypothetical protein XvhCFBP2543_06205 [Xanthomonas vasicola]TWQ42035.1 hypothetical protein FQJ96_00270 [Xanthomonas vasicola]
MMGRTLKWIATTGTAADRYGSKRIAELQQNELMRIRATALSGTRALLRLVWFSCYQTCERVGPALTTHQTLVPQEIV